MSDAEAPKTEIDTEAAAAKDPKSKPTLRERFEELVNEYGPIALGLYFTIFFATWAGFCIAISLGVEVESAAGTAGLVFAAWAATKVTQLLRILATLVLTPVIAPYVRKIWPREPEE